MDERNLMKISVIGVSISLVLLYIVTSQVFSFSVKIGEIDKSFIGKTVNVTGEITRMFQSKGHVFFDLKDDTGKVKVVLWEDTLEFLDINNVNISEIRNGKNINIIGDVQSYKGELEVIPIRGNVNIM
ncbi:MAG: exodeoxyribonuclease VII large subunit [Candidatus Aenigmatarchaeota archaeon]|nr:MAG: exodeoxyribonuclease VII large subunit [Candidatus Aenigmarchaeota archaeon]